ncbi:hypothetical protein JQ604_10730 [Bradyrhizobium jicamae]|uniref:hypothetical protein n=1 Tax=Bradyrhizobium jicamae TaxID=280332 RepID=UPI001BABF451|nr:hypothetical protein [Bradyrhizobium jicamae]MBR0752659.1 hypothetical protein [Bradyrhizobium jicamae]
MIRILLQIVGGVCIVAVFFFGTLYYLNSSDATSRDATRVANVRLLKSALDRYRVAKGRYPAPFPDNPVEDLKPALVDGGLLKSLPADPSDRVMRYSVGGGTEGKRYALKVPLETGDCVTGIGFEQSGWYAPAPPCPF